MQKRKWLRMTVLWLLILSFLTSGTGVLAKTVVKTDVTNNFQMGIVDIELDEYQKDSQGKETSYKDNLQVMPGETVSKIPRVLNEAVDSYVRIKVDISTDFESSHPITLDNISGWNKDLVKIGDYYYYKKILGHGKSFDIFDKVTFPSEWDAAEADGNVKINITVDAIQARNFKPNYDSKNPWGDVEIEHCLHEDGYDFNTFKQKGTEKLSVTLIDKAAGLVHKPDDFFINFGYLLPGDTLTDTVAIKNSYSKPMSLYFASNVLESGGTLDELKLKIVLKLPDGTSRTVYEGKLNTDFEYKLLGTFSAGQEGEFIFTVTVPEELQNKYSLDTGKVKWLFMAEFDEDTPKPEDPKNPPESPQNPPSPSDPPGSTNPPASIPVPTSHIRKSGDTGLLPYVVTFAVSAAGLAVFAIAANKQKKKGEKR